MYSLLCQGSLSHSDVAPFTAAWYQEKLGLDVEMLVLDAEDSPKYPISGRGALAGKVVGTCRNIGKYDPTW